MSLSTTQIWQSIISFSGTSKSVSSTIQRALGQKHFELETSGLSSMPAPAQPADVSAVPEGTTGKVISTSS
ncbi:MAG: hypothetical protein ACK5LI_11385 [Oleidesulfovibrio sp.]